VFGDFSLKKIILKLVFQSIVCHLSLNAPESPADFRVSLSLKSQFNLSLYVNVDQGFKYLSLKQIKIHFVSVALQYSPH